MFVRKPPPHLSEEELARHPSWRRYTRKYRAKRRLVRDVWLGSAIIGLALPPAGLLVLALGTTCLAFVILDETS